MYGNPSFETSSAVTPDRTSRARGPQSPKQPSDPVTSRIVTASNPPSPCCLRIHPMSWFPNAVPVTSMKRSSASRVTVRSHSMPPRVFSIWVYVDRPGCAVHVVRRQPLEERRGVRPAHLDLGEARLVEQAGALAGRDVLGGDRARPVLARPSAGTEPRERRILVRREPVRALPARLLAELRAEVGEPRVRRRRLERPTRLPLLTRVVDVVVRRVDLVRPARARSAASGTARRTGGCPSSTGRPRARRARSSPP